MKSLRHENIYEDIGEFGPYQLLLFFLIGLLAVQPSLTGYGFIFIGATPDYQCKKPAKAQRLSYNNSFDDKCFYKIYSNETSQLAFEPCTEWTYSKEYYDTTLVTEWDLVCSKSYFKDLYLTMHFIGTFAVIVTGVLSDRFGRKKVAFAFVCFNAFLSAVSAMLINTSLFELNFKRTFFAVLKLIYGISSSVYSVAIILVIELTGPNRRILASNFVAITLVVTNFSIGALAYFCRNHKSLSVIIAAISLLIPAALWIVPESPRWLILQKRKTEALRILGKISKSNKKPMRFIEEIESLQNSTITLYSNNNESIDLIEILKLFIKKRLYLFRSLILLLNWIITQVIFYGVSFFTEKFAGNPYLNFIVSTILELFALILILLTTERFGRKVPFTISLGLTGLSFLIIPILPDMYYNYSTYFALFGKFCITFSFNLLYTITSEFYPTFMRNSMTSLLIAIGRFGSISSTYIHVMSDSLKYENLPFLIFGSTSFTAALLFFSFIPETKDRSLPENLDEF